MAGEAAAFCDPAWKVSDVTALSAVTQTHWVPPRVIRVCRASSDTAGHLPGPPQERLLRCHTQPLDQDPGEGGQGPSSKASSRQEGPGKAGSQCQLLLFCLSVRPDCAGIMGSLGVRVQESPSLETLPDPESARAQTLEIEEPDRSCAQRAGLGLPGAVFFGLFLHSSPVHCCLIKYRPHYVRSALCFGTECQETRPFPRKGHLTASVRKESGIVHLFCTFVLFQCFERTIVYICHAYTVDVALGVCQRGANRTEWKETQDGL